jgi:hypothetical protein
LFSLNGRVRNFLKNRDGRQNPFQPRKRTGRLNPLLLGALGLDRRPFDRAERLQPWGHNSVFNFFGLRFGLRGNARRLGSGQPFRQDTRGKELIETRPCRLLSLLAPRQLGPLGCRFGHLPDSGQPLRNLGFCSIRRQLFRSLGKRR